MAINGSFRFGGTVKEMGFTGVEFADDATINHNIGSNVTLNANSTPDGESFAGDEVAMTAGAATIDLTSVQGINTTIDGSGKRVRLLYLKNTGSANIVVSKGASNGYAGLGASFSLSIAPGRQVQVEGDDAASVIGGTNKTLDLAGTGTDTLQYAVIFG